MAKPRKMVDDEARSASAHRRPGTSMGGGGCRCLGCLGCLGAGLGGDLPRLPHRRQLAELTG